MNCKAKQASDLLILYLILPNLWRVQPPRIPPRDRSWRPAGSTTRWLRDPLQVTRSVPYTPRHLAEGRARRRWRHRPGRHRAATNRRRLPLAVPAGPYPRRQRRIPGAGAGLPTASGPTPATSGVDSPPPDPVIQVSEAAVRALTDREQAAASSSRSLPREPADLALPTEPPPEPEPETSDPPAEESADEAEQASIPEPIGWLNER